jgi:16S rRNA (cytosine1402-N4)-methyltransferase
MTAHQSVLLNESIAGLAIKAGGVYVDGTFGRGGHSKAILNQLDASGRLIAIDKDPEAVQYAQAHFSDDPRFSIVQSSFASLSDIVLQHHVSGQVNGILLDLGVSSPQLDNPERGFSFMQSGPLDMRMDTDQSLSAVDFINEAPLETLVSIFQTYGEERFARRIARAIITARQEAPILTTDKLAEIVKQANPKWEKHKHPATRVFQALRIHINQELSDLTDCLKQCIGALAIGGRLVIISFHSLEDRIVKQFMRDQEQGVSLPPGVPVRASEIKTCFKRLGKAIKPHEDEMQHNRRARSAVLRIGEKTSCTLPPK